MIEITKLEELDNLLNNTTKGILIFFKHSNRCPISWNAKKETDAFLEKHTEYKNNTYLINVIDSRPLSNHLADTLKVEHQSPQIIILQNGSVVKHISHLTITEKNLENILQTLK
ncbi:MAG TPA: bacillithiol system redox-active protein YtxJ [Candidatus Hydrogenedens sp.]|nr:bacillithiol system redox-active protein YtxJ [Candidatus Hydrogenedens sp.]